VVNDDEINAMALPGGYLYVNTGLILAADDEAELAGVMAHEIAHVALRHVTRTQSRANIIDMMTIPVIIMGGPAGVIVPEAARVAVPMTLLKFSRGFESEADYFGLQYMYKAGYDPNGLVSLFEKIQAREKRKPGTLAKAFSSHPQTPDRIKKSQEEMASILPFQSQYVETTSEFNDIKARLAMIENGHKFEDSNPTQPVLRRTSSSDGEKTDERPEFKRRLNQQLF
jgi:predicted Zn-dependent protease